MRSAIQLATHCWLDEEVRLGGVRSNGIISNILDPLGSHNDPSPGVGTGTMVGTGVGISMELIPLPNMSVSTASFGAETSRSLAVSRLSAAILQSRFSDSIPLGNVPLHMRHSALEKDTRCVETMGWDGMGWDEMSCDGWMHGCMYVCMYVRSSE